MVKQTSLALNDAADWLGDWHPLAEQLGSADGLLTLGGISSELRLPPVQDVASLECALRQYHSQIMLPVELPAIQAAHGHVSRNELRELVTLDQELSRDERLKRFAPASRRVGQAQLQKLRPLRDQRIVKRYLHAVDIGLAHGWHTLVYGLTLEIYSLALRQGLMGYAHQVTRGFIYSAARMLRLSERQCRDLFESVCADLPNAIEPLIQPPAATV